MAISSGVIVIFTPCCGMGARGPYDGDATIQPQLFVTVDELSSEACWRIVFVHPGGYAVLYIPKIDGDDAEVPDTCQVGALATPVTAVPVKGISGAKWYHSARSRPTRVIQSTSGSP